MTTLAAGNGRFLIHPKIGGDLSRRYLATDRKTNEKVLLQLERNLPPSNKTEQQEPQVQQETQHHHSRLYWEVKYLRKLLIEAPDPSKILNQVSLLN